MLGGNKTKLGDTVELSNKTWLNVRLLEFPLVLMLQTPTQERGEGEKKDKEIENLLCGVKMKFPAIGPQED